MADIAIIGTNLRSMVNFRGNLIRSWVNSGHDVTVLAPVDEEFKQDIEEMDVAFQEIFIDRSSTNPLTEMKSFLSIFREIRDLEPDLIFPYTIKPVIYSSISSWFVRDSSVYSLITGLGSIFVGDSPKKKFLQLVFSLLYLIALWRNEAVIFQNPDDREFFTEKGLVSSRKTHVVNGSGVDITEYEFSTPPAVNSSITFLLVSRLMEEKGIREFANASNIVKNSWGLDEENQLNVELVGHFVPYSPNSLSTATVKDWEDRDLLEHLGYKKDVKPSMRNCHVFVLPSYYREGVPRVVLEAMAIGRPIITTDVPGCRETVIDGENGFLVPPKDSGSLASAMKTFVEDPSLIEPMGKRSRELVEDRFDVRKVNNQINDILGV